jgi:hypothetical protein
LLYKVYSHRQHLVARTFDLRLFTPNRDKPLCLTAIEQYHKQLTKYSNLNTSIEVLLLY